MLRTRLELVWYRYMYDVITNTSKNFLETKIEDEILMYSNTDLENIVTPIRVKRLQELLTQSEYDMQKTEYLIQGFTHGFDLGYEGDTKVRRTAHNLKFTIGNETIMWNKVMKEVQLKRYAGPFNQIPFEYYIQSPLGLVPKDNGTKTRLIFHLSYPKGTQFSVNANTPEHLTKVNYPQFEDAVKLCAKLGPLCEAAKSDLTAAFRQICLKKRCWKWLVMKAKNPITKKFYFFVDKCLPFGASISCAIFQAFSDALAHIMRFKTQSDNINYLDDFFFAALCNAACNCLVQQFLDMCQYINLPVSKEKTEWASTIIVFLGLLIDTKRKIVGIPVEKVVRAKRMIHKMLNAKKHKTTAREIQQLTGFLNFLCKAIIPGRVFTRRAYAYASSDLQPHHHVYLILEIRADLEMWLQFLSHQTAYCRPFLDYHLKTSSVELDLYTDASSTLGCGGYYKNEWFQAEWGDEHPEIKPSINYLELYAVTVAIINWIEHFKNRKVVLFCDNMSVVHMINNTASKCKNCMFLLRLITLKSLVFNTKITAKHVEGISNVLADKLSRLDYKGFREHARKLNKKFNGSPVPLPEQIWPISKIWME